MPVEIKGQQLRIRLKKPSQFSKFRTQDVGLKGRLQRLAGYSKRTGWTTQSWRLNLNDYRNKSQIINQIKKLRILNSKKKEAIKKVRKYMLRRKK